MCQHVSSASIRLGCLVSMSSGLGARERPEDLPVGYWRNQEVQANDWEDYRVWRSPERPDFVCVCVCTCLPAALTSLDPGACSSPLRVGAVQRLSTVMTLSPLNVRWCEGSRAELMLRAFKASHTLSKLEEDFDIDCQTSNKSFFSSPGKHSSVP